MFPPLIGDGPDARFRPVTTYPPAGGQSQPGRGPPSTVARGLQPLAVGVYGHPPDADDHLAVTTLYPLPPANPVTNVRPSSDGAGGALQPHARNRSMLLDDSDFFENKNGHDHFAQRGGPKDTNYPYQTANSMLSHAARAASVSKHTPTSTNVDTSNDHLDLPDLSFLAAGGSRGGGRHAHAPGRDERMPAHVKKSLAKLDPALRQSLLEMRACAEDLPSYDQRLGNLLKTMLAEQDLSPAAVESRQGYYPFRNAGTSRGVGALGLYSIGEQDENEDENGRTLTPKAQRDLRNNMESLITPAGATAVRSLWRSVSENLERLVIPEHPHDPLGLVELTDPVNRDDYPNFWGIMDFFCGPDEHSFAPAPMETFFLPHGPSPGGTTVGGAAGWNYRQGQGGSPGAGRKGGDPINAEEERRDPDQPGSAFPVYSFPYMPGHAGAPSTPQLTPRSQTDKLHLRTKATTEGDETFRDVSGVFLERRGIQKTEPPTRVVKQSTGHHEVLELAWERSRLAEPPPKPLLLHHEDPPAAHGVGPKGMPSKGGVGAGGGGMPSKGGVGAAGGGGMPSKGGEGGGAGGLGGKGAGSIGPVAGSAPATYGGGPSSVVHKMPASPGKGGPISQSTPGGGPPGGGLGLGGGAKGKGALSGPLSMGAGPGGLSKSGPGAPGPAGFNRNLGAGGGGQNSGGEIHLDDHDLRGRSSSSITRSGPGAAAEHIDEMHDGKVLFV